MKIIKKTETPNELFSRVEYALSVEFEGATPSKQDIKALVAKDVGSNEQQIIVKDVITIFGSHVAKCQVFIYSDAKEQERIEALTMHKKIREKIEEQKKKEEEARKAAEEAKKAEEEARAAQQAQANEDKKEE